MKVFQAIDLFAGGGGFSTAARLAGVHVAAAVNHDPRVVQYHALNHPATVHGCYGLDSDTDYNTLPSCDILLASPCCQGHSFARGTDAPQHDASRATALAVVAAVQAKMPGVVVVENVPEFRLWGKGGDGSRYRWWKQAFTNEGYLISENILDAADFGVPSHRTRLFLLMVHESLGTGGPVVVENPGLAHVPASAVIDNSGRFDHYLEPIADKCLATRQKVARQQARLGLDEWLFCYRGKGYGYTMQDTIGTITTHDHWCYVRGERMRFLQPDEMRDALGFPADYILPSKPKKLATHMLGNSVAPPAAAAVIRTGVGALLGSSGLKVVA